jgi:ankyrin repeat protein
MGSALAVLMIAATDTLLAQAIETPIVVALSRALLQASAAGDLDALDRALEAGANVNATVRGDGSALIAAARQGRVQIVEALLNRGADPNLAVRGDGNALIAAAREGQIAVVELLLSRGASIDQVVDGDENAIIQASGAGRLAVVKLLVARGADVNARVRADSWDIDLDERRPEWRTPLGMAIQNHHDDVADFLRLSGAVADDPLPREF